MSDDAVPIVVTRAEAKASARVHAVVRALIVLGVLVGWFAAVRTGAIPVRLLPDPVDVGRALGQIVVTPEFWESLRISLMEMAASLLFGGVVGMALAFVLWLAPDVLGRVVEPYIVAFYGVPIIVFYPLLIVIVGINSWSVMILAGVSVAIPMLINTWLGLREIPRVYFKLSASLGWSLGEMIRKVAFPSAATQIMAGVRLGTAMAIVATMAMEFLLAPAGLGFDVRYAYQYFDQPGMYAYIVIVFLIAAVAMGVVMNLERRVHRGRE